MLELRIKRRLRSLNLNSFGQYCDYLFGPHGEKGELVHLLDVVSTNKTDFFREPEHFEFLVEKAIPDLVARNQSGRPFVDLERRVLHRRGALHPGDDAE